jgi:hypothetical protein
MRAEDEILLVGLTQEVYVFLPLDSPQFLYLPFHLDVVGGREVDFGVTHQYAVKEGVETEIVFEDRVFQLFYILFEVLLNSIPVQD